MHLLFSSRPLLLAMWMNIKLYLKVKKDADGIFSFAHVTLVFFVVGKDSWIDDKVMKA